MNLFHDRYEQQKQLGRGAFSEVWKAYDTKTKVVVAIKIYNAVSGQGDGGDEMLAHEFGLMVDCSHKNLLKPLYFDSCDNKPYLVLPYCKRGNISNMIGKMSEDEAWRLIRDMASALAFLHAKNPPILHQDIKPANILLSDNGDYMLTDFGVSTHAKATLSRVSNEELNLLTAGTIAYMAPERFSRKNLPIAPNDIYSLGATVYEMLSGDPPFGNDGGLLQQKGAEIPELPGAFSPMFLHTIDACLDADPNCRPTAAKLEDVANDALRYPEERYNIPVFEPITPSSMQATQPMGYPQQMGGYNPQQPSGYNSQMGGYNPQQPSGYNSQMGGYNTQQPSGYNSQMGGYTPQQPSGYNSQMGGYNPQQPSGYNSQMGGYNPQQPSGYNSQMGGYNQQPSGYNPMAEANEMTDGRKRSKTPLYVTIGCVALVCILAAAYFLFFTDEKNPTPVVKETMEQRFERAKRLILYNTTTAQIPAGRDSLIKLSEEGYSPATFLYSRLMFENQSPDYGLDDPDWRKMKDKLAGYLPIDNRRAHELLELAVKQDPNVDNWKAWAELGYDYYKGKDRCPDYEEFFLQKGHSQDASNDENLKKAHELFINAGGHPDADRTKTTSEASRIQATWDSYGNGTVRK